MTCYSECTQFDLAMELLIENGAEAVGLLMKHCDEVGEISASQCLFLRQTTSTLPAFVLAVHIRLGTPH